MTTFQVFDESHRFTLQRLKQAHQTMMANLPKRKLADSWALEITADAHGCKVKNSGAKMRRAQRAEWR